MKNVKIKNLNGLQTHGGEFANDSEMNLWINDCVEKNLWGKKAGFYPINELTESELAQEISRITFNDNGDLLEFPQVEIPDQYSIEIHDLTAQIELENESKRQLKNKLTELKSKQDLSKADIEFLLKTFIDKVLFNHI